MMRMVSRLMPLVDAASTSVITSGDGPRFGVGDGDGGGWVAGVLGAAGVEGGSEGGADDGGERHGGAGNGDEFVFDIAVWG